MTVDAPAVDQEATTDHASGEVLLAVAEGNSDRQPSEDVLVHVFSCPQCSATLRELRLSLKGLSTGADPSMLSLDDSPFEMPAAEEDPRLRRARKMLIGFAIIGGIVIGATFLFSRVIGHWLPG